MADIVDIVFLIDNTGSMSSYINKVKSNVTSFANSLQGSGIDYRLGLVEFGDIYDSSIKNYAFTNNIETFINDVNAISLTNGNDTPESGLEALVNSASGALSMDFRPEASKRFIVVTDASFHNQGESGDGDSGAYLETSAVLNELLANGVFMDVVGTQDNSWDNCRSEWEPLANATGGQFYDINGDFPTLFQSIVDEIIEQSTNIVSVNLNEVGEGQTGVFIVNQVTNADGTTSITSVATFKAAAEEGDIVVGNVTEPNVYVAEAESEYRQNITIPENWNATGTNNDDILRFTGNNATATGSAGNDRFYVSSGVNNATFGDFTPSEDSLSFASQIPENSLYQSMIENALVLSNDNINLTFKNTPNLTTELAGTTVSNGGVTNTISELIAGATISDIVVDPDAPVMMSLSHWSYGFYPPTE